MVLDGDRTAVLADHPVHDTHAQSRSAVGFCVVALKKQLYQTGKMFRTDTISFITDGEVPLVLITGIVDMYAAINRGVLNPH